MEYETWKVKNLHSTVKFEVTSQNNVVTFRVQDWGIGIAKNDQGRLFQPFIRGENVGSISGTGMGLAIAKKCVKAHGGEIGVGTTLTVNLPLIKM
ncbi:HAMP domain-containing histidine kinase [Anabaena cylindrica FACHB-243]|nr:HAMP domain-containing histidine kinase [Anabaena cylindrica FACHB-243]MBY5283199.1 HAMP domain-containing histidine kinase [Anabaena sp. CCAP 1446/1C]MBY5308642.1 HAMP domain-containing histidine kinase [Anabaena sp. CCAP 1446/1C]